MDYENRVVHDLLEAAPDIEGVEELDVTPLTRYVFELDAGGLPTWRQDGGDAGREIREPPTMDL